MNNEKEIVVNRIVEFFKEDEKVTEAIYYYGEYNQSKMWSEMEGHVREKLLKIISEK